MNIEIRKTETEELLGSLFQAYRNFANTERADMFPEQSLLTDKMIRYRLEDPDNNWCNYLAFEKGLIVGYCQSSRFSTKSPLYEQNKNRAGFGAFILREFRNQGLGSKLARATLQDPFLSDIEQLRTYSYNAVGEKFAGKLGGKVVSKSSVRQLPIKNVDWNLVNDWLNLEFPQNKKPIVEFYHNIEWKDAQQLVDLSFSSMQELHEMDNKGISLTRENEEIEWRDGLKYWAEFGYQHDWFILKDSSGNIIGYTTCTFGPTEPKMAQQGMTTVWKHFRGNGYGKLLKALMLDNLRKNHPQIEIVDTGNNDLNAPMVAINRKLGFIEKNVWCSYFFDRKQALETLGGEV